MIANVCAFEVPPPGVPVNTVTDAVPAVAISAAVIVAVNWFAEPKLVVRLLPFQRTVEPLMKSLPLTVSVKPALPAIADDGERPVVAGTGFGAVIVSVWAFDVPPPGAGVNTVIDALPLVAMSAAVIDAVNCVAEPKVVVRLLPLMRTTDEPFTKPVPLTVNEKAAPPAVTEAGLILVVVGTGFVGGLIVNVCAFDVPPPVAGVRTVTDRVPADAMSAAVIAAVNCVEDTKVVVRVLSFQRTSDVGTKPDPFTVNVKAAPPAVADAGAMLVVTGTPGGGTTPTAVFISA